jgi:hypothetical protein
MAGSSGSNGPSISSTTPPRSSLVQEINDVEQEEMKLKKES